MIRQRFIDLVEASTCPDESAAGRFETWLASLSLEEVALYVKGLISDVGYRSLCRRLTPNPPSVLDLCDLNGYVLQLLYWYPLADKSIYGAYDTEDIHSHFSYIATKALRGRAYVMDLFQLSADGSVHQTEEMVFDAGMHRTIAPVEIHRVRPATSQPALSIRVVLPPVVGRMRIYDRESGLLKQEITASSERRAVELAGIVATLDRDLFSGALQELADNCLLADSRNELERLISLG